MASPAGVAVPAPARSIDRFFEICLLGMLASGYFAVLGSGFLDLPVAVLVACALLVRVLFLTGIVRLDVPPKLVTVLTLLYIGFYPLDYSFVSREFIPATVHLVFFLAVTKLLTARSDRDFSFLRVVAFLELLAASIVSGGANFFLFLALFLLFTIGTFASGEIRRCTRREVKVVRAGLHSIQWRVTGLTVCVGLGVLVLTAGMFFLLPRTARAAFQHLVPERYHLPGFSNEVSLGEIGEIKTNNTAVMRVRSLLGNLPANVKWRGTALVKFDGRRWYNPMPLREQTIRVDRPQFQLIPDQERPQGDRVGYEVHVQDIGSDVLFFAGKPEYLTISSPFVKKSWTDSYRLPYGYNSSLAYISYDSFPRAEGGGPARPLAESAYEYLQLPTVDPRVAALARTWSAGTGSAEGEAAAIERHLRTEYRYTLQLPKTQPADPIANFVLERRAGHCEYFASAMAVMLRVMGIPSRVVTGFQSGTYNPVSGWRVIRASDAHSWVEAWIPKRGWTVYDPTPPDPNVSAAGMWTRLGFYLDAAETFWQEWVLNYNLERQLLLALKMQESTRTASVTWLDGSGVWFDAVRHGGGDISAALRSEPCGGADCGRGGDLLHAATTAELEHEAARAAGAARAGGSVRRDPSV